MSRWTQQFETHAYRQTWENLIEALGESYVDDETIVTTVDELARLRKAISYVDGILSSLDPDLVPLATWDNFQKQADPCLGQINNYNSNRNPAHIQQANAHADNLLTYVRPYMIADGKIGKALQQSTKEYAITLEAHCSSFREKAKELIESIEKIKDSSEKDIATIESIKSLTEELKIELFGQNDDEGTKQKIRELEEEIESKHEKINDAYNEILVGDGANPPTTEEITSARDLAVEQQKEINELLEEIASDIKELQKFHKKIFGNSEDGENTDTGLSGNLDTLVGKLSAFEKEQQTRYTALNEEINSLLPGATSAGLASAYNEMRNSFDNPIKNASMLFYISIAVLVFASFILAIDSIGGESLITFVRFNEWTTVLKGLAYKIPFYAPVLWLAFYASKRRSEYQRLQQEYAHKEALAKSYNSYKKQIEELDDSDLEMQKSFIMKAIDAIAYNASGTLDGKHGDKMPAQDLIEKIVTEAIKRSKLVG